MVAIPVYSVLRIVGRAFWLNMKKIQIEVE
jgi:hypothetical protein